MTDKYENAHRQAVAIEFSRSLEHELSILRTFCKLKMCVYKRARQSGQESVRIQSALCKVACDQNGCGCKQNSELLCRTSSCYKFYCIS